MSGQFELDQLALERIWRAVGNLADDEVASVSVRDLRELLVAYDETAAIQALYDQGEIVDVSELRALEASSVEAEAEVQKKLDDANEQIRDLEADVERLEGEVEEAALRDIERDLEAMRAA